MKHIWVITWIEGKSDWFQVVTTDAEEALRTLVVNPEANVKEWEITSDGDCELIGP